MSIAGFKIEYMVGGRDGGDAVMETMAAAFERAGDELNDFGKFLFPRMTPVFEDEMKAQFSAEGRGPAVGHWAPLSSQYAQWKEEHYPGKPILQREGVLHDALTTSSSPFARRVSSGETFDFGTLGVEYASVHQLGGSHIQARPPVDLGDDFQRLLEREGVEAAREAIHASGADEFISSEGA